MVLSDMLARYMVIFKAFNQSHLSCIPLQFIQSRSGDILLYSFRCASECGIEMLPSCVECNRYDEYHIGNSSFELMNSAILDPPASYLVSIDPFKGYSPAIGNVFLRHCIAWRNSLFRRTRQIPNSCFCLNSFLHQKYTFPFQRLPARWK